MSSGTAYGRPDEPGTARASGSPEDRGLGVLGADATRGVLIALGCVSIVMGGFALFWPDATVTVIAVLFGLQLLFHGVLRIVQAIAIDEARVGARILLALLGLLSVVVGVLCMRNPLQTAGLLALIIGLFWLLGGLIEVIRAATDRTGGRGFEAVGGVLGVLAGLVVLSWPAPTVLVVTVLVGAWILVFGVIMIIAGVRVGRQAGRTAPATA